MFQIIWSEATQLNGAAATQGGGGVWGATPPGPERVQGGLDALPEYQIFLHFRIDFSEFSFIPGLIWALL